MSVEGLKNANEMHSRDISRDVGTSGGGGGLGLRDSFMAPLLFDTLKDSYQEGD